MANPMLYLKKDDQRLPDHYGLKVYYLDGKVDEFEVATHRLGPTVLEITTSEDQWNWLVVASIKRVEFDKRFSQIIALKEERLKDKRD